MATEDVEAFMGITASSEVVATSFLSMTNGDVMQAVTLFFENPELQHSLSAQATSSTATSAPTARAAGRSNTRNRIVIPDDDDEDEGGMDNDQDEEDTPEYVDLDDDEDDEVQSTMQAANVARAAQEDEDAAMARRIQEEMYADTSNVVDEDGVRAPMARTTETLVAPNGMYGMDDDEDDVQAQVLEQLRRRRQPRDTSARGNPFSQSIWNDPDMSDPLPASSGAVAASTGGNAITSNDEAPRRSRAQRLADLFRPPYELIAPIDRWDDARLLGKEDKKWIMVNFQDMTDFNCQALNRDLWKDEDIITVIKENFIFLQYTKGDPRGSDYQTLYMHGQTAEAFPHVSIIDPRTGEQVKSWTGAPFPSTREFYRALMEFLVQYSLVANAKNPVLARQQRPAEQQSTVVDVDRMTEDEQLRMAMMNSLEGTAGASSGSTSAQNGFERAVSAVPSEPEQPATPAPANEPSAFSLISSDRPHSEPANDPATTTRIQFRHAGGRVIRRFALSDCVQRIYEWLKAEPLEGQDGANEFELKVVPEGRNLLEELEKSVAEAGLRQATVAVEYIQP